MAESLKQIEELARRHENKERARGRLKTMFRSTLSVNAFKDAGQSALADEAARSRAALEQARAAAEANAAEEAARRDEAKDRLKKASAKLIEAGKARTERELAAGRRRKAATAARAEGAG